MPHIKLFGKKKSDSPEGCLVVGVGSSYVTTMCLEVLDGSVKVVGAEKSRIEQKAVSQGRIDDLSFVVDALQENINKMVGYLDNIPREVAFALSGGNSYGLMTISRVKRDPSIPITVKELDSMYKRTVEASSVRMQSEMLVQKGDPDVDMELVSSSVLYTRIDGKNVSNPVGMECGSLEMAASASFTPRDNLRILKKLAKKSGLKPLWYGYDVFSLVGVLERTGLENINYILIHMGSDFTNVGVVFGGGLVATRSLSVGRDHFAQEISMKLGVAFREADKMLTDYSLNKLSESENLIIRDTIGKTLELWLSGLELLFSEFSGIKTFASKIYLTGEGFDIPDIYEILVTEPWTKSIPFREPPEFSKLPLSEIPFISDLSGNASSLEWTMPASLSVLLLDK